MTSVLLADKAYERIKAQILRAAYSPNSPLPEAELQRELNMGRTPIREALIRLQQEGLVQIVPRRGAFVQTLTLRDARNLYHVRALLEPEAVRLAFPHILPDELDAFEQRFRELEESGQQQMDAEELIKVDQEFHRYFLRKCDNPYLVEIIERLHNQSRLAWAISAHDRPRILATSQNHLKLLAALRRKDVDEAAKYMREHVLAMYETIVSWAG